GCKMLVVFCVLLTVPFFLGFSYFHYQKYYIVQEKQQELAAIADLKVGQIIRWRNERMKHVEYIFSNPLFYKQLKIFFDNPDNPENKTSIEKWLKSIQTLKLFDDIYLLDAKGAEVLSYQTSGPLGSHAKELIKQTRLTLRPIVSDLHTASTVYFAHMDVTIPIVEQNRPDSYIGMIFMRLKPQSDLFPLIQSWPTPSSTAETLLIRQEGDSVLFLNELRHRPNTALKLRYPLSKDNSVAVKTVKGAEGVIEGVDYRDVPVLAVSRKIPGTPWFMVTKVDRQEIYAPLRQQAWIASISVFLLSVIAAGIVRFWWLRQHARFNTELYEERLRAEEAGNMESEQRGKMLMVSSVLHDIGNALTSIGTLAVKHVGETNWPEIQSMSMLRKMFSDQAQALEQSLGSEKAAKLQAFLAKLEESLVQRKNMILETSRKMASMVSHMNDVLLLQRIYASGRKAPASNVSLKHLADDAVLMMSASLQKRNINVVFNADDELEEMRLDKTRIIQVLMNLLKNAAESFDVSGRTENRRIEISIRQEDHRQVIEISDNAAGFDPVQHDRLFEDGFSTKKRSSGIGLYHCASLIESYGGKIELSSNGPEQGAVARITLPMKKTVK
ncbi:MAG: sensor histidine kinase, partial [Victivallaceae bacterium]